MFGPAGPGALLRDVFRLEAERVLALARLGRDPGAEAALDDVDARLGAALDGLERHGVAYPAHDVARRHGFGQHDYALLQLALLRWHGPGAVREVTRLLGDADREVRVSHAIALLLPGRDDWQAAYAELADLPIVREGLVTFTASGPDDAALGLGTAMRELLGLGLPPG